MLIVFISLMSEPHEEEGPKFEIFGWEPSEIKLIILFIVLILTFLSLVRIAYEKTKMKVYVPESCLLILIGIIIGCIITYSNTD